MLMSLSKKLGMAPASQAVVSLERMYILLGLLSFFSAAGVYLLLI
jgi:hypothetical protein